MKTTILILLLLCIPMSFAQKTATTKKAKATIVAPSTPSLSDEFAKAGLKALFAIQDDSFKSRELLEDVRVEMDTTARPAEALMFANLLIYQREHATNLLKRSSLRSQTVTKMIQESMPGSANPIFVQAELQKNQDYGALVAKDNHCVAKLEKDLRGRIVSQEPACSD